MMQLVLQVAYRNFVHRHADIYMPILNAGVSVQLYPPYQNYSFAGEMSLLMDLDNHPDVQICSVA